MRCESLLRCSWLPYCVPTKVRSNISSASATEACSGYDIACTGCDTKDCTGCDTEDCTGCDTGDCKGCDTSDCTGCDTEAGTGYVTGACIRAYTGYKTEAYADLEIEFNDYSDSVSLRFWLAVWMQFLSTVSRSAKIFSFESIFKLMMEISRSLSSIVA